MTTTRSAMSATTPEVVGDQNDRGAEPVAQLAEDVEHAGLDRDVERGGRLVGDQHLRRQATAMAIITRWRIPPDSWCGYSPTRRCGSGMPTSSQQLDGAGPGGRARTGARAGAAPR